MAGSREATGASDGDDKEGVGRRAPLHADQYKQPRSNILEPRLVAGGGEAAGASNRDE